MKIFRTFLVAMIIIAFSMSSCKNNHQKGDSNKDSLPYSSFWNIIKDSLKISAPTFKNGDIAIDTSRGFEIYKGHFTNKVSDECILQRTLNNRRGNVSKAACLFTYNDNQWNFKRFILQDSLRYVDVNRDSLFEIFQAQELIVGGSSETFISIMSLKENKINYLFKSVSVDMHFSEGAFTTSKFGDTIVNTAKYDFFEMHNSKALALRERRKLGMKKAISIGDNKLVINYKSYDKVFIIKNGVYKAS